MAEDCVIRLGCCRAVIALAVVMSDEHARALVCVRYACLDGVADPLTVEHAAFWSGGIWPVKFCQQAFAECGRSACLEVDGDVTSCHGRPRSSGPARDGADCGDHLGGIEVERIEQEVIQGLPEQRRGQGAGREVSEVIGDDHVGAACPGGCHHVPVIWVWQPDGRGKRFPASYERVRERRFHLLEETGEIGIGFFWRCPALAHEQAKRAVKFGEDLCAPQWPVGTRAGDLEQDVAGPAGHENAGVEQCAEHAGQSSVFRRAAFSAAFTSAGSASYRPSRSVSATMSANASSA